MKLKNQILAIVAIVLAAATAQAQSWTTSGTNAVCTNGGTRFVIKNDGTVWVGDASGTQKSTSVLFFVDAKMKAREVVVNMANWPDYVFDSCYVLIPLDSLAGFIDSAHHLPNVPSATQVTTNGLGVGNMSEIMMRKIEELQLYILQLNARIKELEEAKPTVN